MSRIHVESERVIHATPEKVYETLTDYKEKRQLMLTPNFLDYMVVKGGKGEGTIISYRLQAAQRERAYRMQVTEPAKGKIITESDSNSSLVTTWKLLPMQGGQSTIVSVSSEWEGGQGVGGFFERTFAPLGLRRIYDDMLALLASLVQTGSVSEVVTAAEMQPSRSVLLLASGVALVAVAGIYYMQKAKRAA
ncbi:SRPBCC family protein [Ktedonosporobacter rubrisoli]|uniref:SRPBCC family protein n=1 Tax=Ktedonosporobacter rubrisoli TaxID=2509675 RepID=A0A4P6K2B0_KTERU|nr:SRPBCC family protein [Ktedonosporobacter rubrisoli]QBD81616.1 SRPBCC family protein [Ktedonosporobacter rubrisoli]